MDKEQKIIDSWTVNATNWIEIIENNGIESRRLVTNQAIIDIVCMDNPATVLDLGCGEGWLSKELQHKGIEITGVDVINELIEKKLDLIEACQLFVLVFCSKLRVIEPVDVLTLKKIFGVLCQVRISFGTPE